ncbi:5-(carboxyamino)imidazole ribonucleotide synthase [Microbulbifer sp. OS29]|uniref:N5-carboxyaminoimidazole ribonucleotide synthase n=1 Tax=Microbulbifer okhotskensis TaxID=2926617 RepID=A0A9X2ETE5_9GAMM|nr:5-(carboxyamino)imidazole ribonucleotide synthase [Microbulbifer okhotskensis]MCO1335438.1 5-(carboxyamino)imidazole ribonucleotide synthase [Microbulbifer okhotskensis]
MSNRRVAIIGCGQLAQMMAQEGRPLGVEFSFLAEGGENTDCVQGLGVIVQRKQGQGAEALYQALGCPEVITSEREQVSVGLLRALQRFCPIYPDPHIIEKAQHRLREKRALTDCGLPVAPFVAALKETELRGALDQLGFPAFIKSCENGYDGKNQWCVTNAEELEAALPQTSGQECVVEAGVDFACEVSIIGARSVSGEIKAYPLTENRHQKGTLILSRAPYANPELVAVAEHYLKTLLRDWDYVGVLAVECFICDRGLIINEVAPRVHNSGHWTLEGTEASQFTNHIRAILDMPLGDTSCPQPVVMVNLLGVDTAPKQLNQSVCWYGKKLRPGRKMGHVILQDFCEDNLRQRSEAVIKELYGAAKH